MKIAVNTRFLMPDQMGGIGRFTHEILQRLTVNHPEHDFYFFFDRAYDSRFIYSANIKPVVLYPSARHPFLAFWWYQVSLVKALKKLQPDVFLSMDGMTTLNTAVPRVIGMPDIAFAHYPQDFDYVSRKYYRYYMPKFAQVSDKIISGSEFTQQDISRQYEIAPEKITVVYNAAGSHFKPVNFEREVRIRQKYTQGEAYFLYVGGLQPRKNLANLLKAYDLFKQRTGSEVKLVVTGPKARKSGSLTKILDQMQFKNDVVFTGQVNDAELVPLYGAAVATVYVPVFEGTGIPVLEAQKCGCPVITSNAGAMPEIAGNGALYVNPFAIAEICDALIRVYHNLEVRALLVKEGYENTRCFSWDQSARRVMAVLDEVVRANKRDRAHI